MRSFLVSYWQSDGRLESGYGNVRITTKGGQPTLADVRKVEQHLRDTSGKAIIVVLNIVELEA